jgi:hypothetical protein
MTLVMSLFGDDFTILLSDRRLSCDGKVVDDESNKAAAIVMEDATLACAFTGLARCKGFSTQDWLLDALLECAPADFLSVPTLQRLQRRISTEFAENKDLRSVPGDLKRLAVLFAGFHFAPEGVFRVSALLTNFAGFAGPGDLPYEPKEFVLREIRMDTPSRVGFAGAWRAVSDDDVASLNKMLAAGNKANAVLGKAIDLFHKIADRPSSGGLIGGQLNSIVVRNSRPSPIETGYHVRNSSPISYMANLAILTRAQTLLAKGGMMHTSDEVGRLLPNAPPSVVPKVHRNAYCPCGSKKKYSKCHGRRSNRREQNKYSI